MGNLTQHFQFDHSSLTSRVPLSCCAYIFLPYVNCASDLTFGTASLLEQWPFHLWIKFHNLLLFDLDNSTIVGDAALLFADHAFSIVSFRSCKTKSFLVCSFNCTYSRFSSEIGNICSRGGRYQEKYLMMTVQYWFQISWYNDISQSFNHQFCTLVSH